MPSKFFLFSILILATRTQLISSSTGLPPTDEDVATEFTTERADESFISSTTKSCSHNDKPQFSTVVNEGVAPEITLRHLDDRIARIQEIVAGNKAMLSKLRKTPSQHEHYPRHCLELKEQGHNFSDIYFIKPKYAPEPFLVFCDMETRGGGWTVLLVRIDGTLDFDLDWRSYIYGFGQMRHEFWLGLEKIHYLTGHEINELLLQVNEWGPKEAFFSAFSIGNEDEDYTIKLLEGYKGDTGSSLLDSIGAKFSTKDRSLDPFNMKCAILSGGGWWHRNCGSAILTSKWTVYNVMSWQYARMMVRPRSRNATK